MKSENMDPTHLKNGLPKSPLAERQMKRESTSKIVSKRIERDFPLSVSRLAHMNGKSVSPQTHLAPEARSSRRRYNRTDNIETASPEIEDDFETALSGKKLHAAPNGFQSPDAHRLAEVQSSTKKSFPLTPLPVFSTFSTSRHLTPAEVIKRFVLEKITGKRPIHLIGFEQEYEKVHTLVEQTVLAGEGNSMLLIGARGCGKSALVNTVLEDLSKNNREHYHIIRLNGFIQTDDKLALREIWRQLGQEMEVEEEGPMKNYADTLSTLLALLSHSPETGTTESQVARSVVFVIDEFDLFAAHPRQTLLYNLFDIAQSRKAPIAVLGLTTRVDVVESLEKRVKSRFSHRYVYLGLPRSLATFQLICKSALQVRPEELEIIEQLKLSSVLEQVPSAENGKTSDALAVLVDWNRSIDSFLASANVAQFLSRIYHTSKSVPTALMAFHVPVAICTTAPLALDASSFTADTLLQAPDSKLSMLPSLSSLSLALLICAARLDIILGTDTCNFNMVYDEYSTLAAKARLAASTTVTGVGIGGKVWGQEVARAAWERLVDVGLLITAVGTGNGLSAADMVRCDVALEEIEGAVPDVDRTLEKWCRDL